MAQAQVRALGMVRTTAATTTMAPAATSTQPDGRVSPVDWPVMAASTTSSTTVTTNWTTWTRATVATPTAVGTPLRLRKRRLMAAPPTPAGATSETTALARCTSVERHRESRSGLKATSVSPAPT